MPRIYRSAWSRAVTEVGAMAALSASTITRALRRPHNFGPMGILAGGFLGQLGALDRLGGIYNIATVREFAPVVTGIVVAGAIGTAICADLGSRRAREEFDALAVLGVDAVKSLVVPRFLALISISLLFNSLGLVAGLIGAIGVEAEHHAPIAPFFASFFSSGSTTELGASYLKALVFGAMIAIVCCYKGMNVSRGAEGVGRAVNEAVVVCFLLIGAIDYVFTQVLLATHPALSQVR
jgi:phospholipid/cholesterol/gamma-HCH transport system permease protein